MSVDLAGCLVVGLEGPRLMPAELAWLRDRRPAGVILFARNVVGPAQTAALCRQLHGLVPGLEIVVDHEGGPVAQMAAAAGRPPAAWGLGRLDDPQLTRRVCLDAGRRLADLGVTRVLGPVADVLEYARNPVIGARAFGADPALCARHVAAAVAGYRAAGLRVCLKHWPGHGGTATDSHLGIEAGLVDGCQEPFLAGLAAGADAVMVGHLPIRNPQGEAGCPATLDADYLAATRTLLTVDGLAPTLIADDVTMGALRHPMRLAGVEIPDDGTAGLVDPGVLSRDWLQRLADAGCTQLLIRGIPWRAMPGPGEADMAETVGQAPSPFLEPIAVPDPETWRQARARLWASEAGLWADPTATVYWLDLTAGDRWGAADERSGAAFLTALERCFAAVQPGLPPAWPGSGACRLLVTSHRPLPAGALAGFSSAPGGVALAMGHPSLAPELASILGAGWRVGGLFDCDAADLPPAP